MSALPPAVHRAIVCVDVESFGDRRRTRPDQIAVRDGMYGALSRAFDQSGVRWRGCYHEDRGDGVLVLVPAEVPKNLLVTGVLDELVVALAQHNRAHDGPARIRLRLAVHAGEVQHDVHGVTGTAINVAFRLLEAEAVKRALAGSSGALAVIASQWFFDEVIRHDPASAPGSYRKVPVSGKETRADAWLCLPDDPYPPQVPIEKDSQEDSAARSRPAAEPAGVAKAGTPRQLPHSITGFAGRKAELDQLTGVLKESAGRADRGGTVTISVIGGMAGIGKTTLAVHWAHQVADQFPDGQLYVDLRGFDPIRSPMAPSEAICGFLDALNVPPERVPAGLDSQSALYRSRLADRRMLVVLDNARDSGQVRPLLPGAPGCVVLVTSRHQLTGLITQGALPVVLDVLTDDQARQQLTHRIGLERMAAEPEAVDEIIAACGGLPLALAIVAARVAAHPAFTLSALARELSDTRYRLEALAGGEATADVRAVFTWSYEGLGVQAAQMFRLLALHPGPDITAPAAASLPAVTTARARITLAELAQVHLLTENTPGRFAFHDLLRAYATELTQARDGETTRREALHRVLDHYLHAAHAAALRLHPRTAPITLAPAVPKVTTETFTDHDTAWEWFQAEYPVLTALVQQATAHEFHDHGWQIPWALEEYFERRGHWHLWVTTQQAALNAAAHSGDRHGLASAHRGLGRVCRWLGRFDDGHRQLRTALRLYEELGDDMGQAHTHANLGWMFCHQGHPEKGLAHAQRALELFRATGDRLGHARSLNQIGWYHALLADHHQAIAHCRKALALSEAIGDHRGQAHALSSLGHAHHHLGDHQRAIAYYRQSLPLSQESGDQHGHAMTLDHLGDTYHAIGDTPAAHESWQHAMDILHELRHAHAARIRAKLSP